MEIRDARDLGLQRTLEWLGRDVIGNLFAVNDITKDPKNTSLHFASEGASVQGYLLQYKGLSYPVVILRGREEASSHLLDLIRGQKVVLFTDPPLLNLIKERLEVSAVFEEDLMLVEEPDARLARANQARRLTTQDAPKVAELYSGLRDEREAPVTYARWIQQHFVCGAFIDNRLASVGGTWAEIDECWMLGGIYTSPDLRNKGFATMVTSTITWEATQHAGKAALYVTSKNRPAIRVYEKVGYKKIGERLWVDIGVGIEPLTA